MGISNLLRELKPITSSNVHIEMFSGKRCGVDASCWLHRASYSCAWDIVSGKKTNKWLGFTLKYIKLLQHYNITPIIVFDGDKLPMKANEEYRRNETRDYNKKEAIKCYENGDKENGYKYATRAIRITKDMVTAFINQCIKNNIQFVCAPYEADAQLGYMYKNGNIDFVISEDSDLLLFGVRKVFYKFDKGRGDLIDMDDIKEYSHSNGNNKNKKRMDLCLFLKKYGDIKEFINVCVLSGCDYVKSLPGIGLKTAVKHCNEYNRNINRLILILVQKMQMEKKEKPPKDYKIQFKRAVLTFLHQTVYDINTKKLTHLNPLTQDVNDYLEELRKHLSRLPQQANNRNNRDNNKNPTVYDTTLDFLGKKQNENTAILIAEGKIDARSLKQRHLITLNQENRNRNNNNNNNGENGDIETNRFFAPSKPSKQQRNNNNVFQSGSNQNNIRNERRRYRKKNTPKKEKKYFGAVNKENDDALNGDLDDLLTQFGYQNNNNCNHNDNQWDNTEDTCTLDMDEKDNDDNINGIDDDEIIVPNSDQEEEDENYDNKPLKKRSNRKRKRNAIDQDLMMAPLKPIKNINNTSFPMKSKRKLNNGSIQFNNHHHIDLVKVSQKHDIEDIHHHKTTPNSKFIQKTTPKNVQELKNKSVSFGDGLISDLFSSSKSRLTKKRTSNDDKDRYQNKENIARSSNKNRNRMRNKKKNNNNPFSVDRKTRKSNNKSSRKSLAMIGAKNKPIDISDTESDIESDNDVEIISIKCKPHPFLSYQHKDDDKKKKKKNKNMNNIGCNDEFYEVLDDEENDDNDEIYSQLSQSQSEKQVTDVLNEFHIQSQRNDEIKDEDTNDDDDDDDDIQIIENVIERAKSKKKIKKMEATECKKFKPPQFKKPRHIDGNKKLPNKNKKKTQKKLTNYFIKKS